MAQNWKDTYSIHGNFSPIPILQPLTSSTQRQPMLPVSGFDPLLKFVKEHHVKVSM